MKKLFFFLLAALPLMFTACSDDDDLPDVDFTIAVDGGVYADGAFYVVQGETFTIKSITVTNKESGKSAMITSATYYWDGYYLGASLQSPYGFEIEITESTPVGHHTLEIVSPLLAEGKSIANALIVYDIQVVATADDIPTGGTATVTATPAVTGSN